MCGNPCLILEWSEADQWPALLGRVPAALGVTPLHIPPARRPAVIQPDEKTALAEARRLALAHPDKRFAVFEAKVVGMAVSVPSHITVGGEVFQHSTVARIVEIDDSGIPF